MSRPRVVLSGRYDPPPAAREALLTRSLASAIAVGAPVGIVIWLAWQQMSNITWFLTQLLQHLAQ